MLVRREQPLFYKYPQFADFPKDEYSRRIDMVRKYMASEKIDLLTLWDEDNVRYFCGFHSQHWKIKSLQCAVLILPLECNPILIVPEFFRGMAEASTYVQDIRGYEKPHYWSTLRGLPREVAKVISDIGYRRRCIGLEDGKIANMFIPRPPSDIDLLRSELPDAKFVPGADVIWKCRMIKSDLEIETLKTACALTVEAFSDFVENFSLGMTEKEAGSFLYSAIARRGKKTKTMYFVGDVSRYPMIDSFPSYNGIPMSRGNHVAVECFGDYKGYIGGVGRCLEIGEISEAKWEYIKAVEYGQDAALATIRDGINSKDVIAAVTNALGEKGFKSTGFVGHGIGLTGQEPPILAESPNVIIRKGMVLALEIWIYDLKGFTRGGRLNMAPGEGITNLGHFGLEEYIVVTDNGYEMLPTFPRDIRIIPR